MAKGAIVIKTPEEIELIRVSSLLVGKTQAEVASRIQPGITTKKLDDVAEMFIRDHGGVPSFKGYNGFKGSLCVSLNEARHKCPSCVGLATQWRGAMAALFFYPRQWLFRVDW